MAYKEEQLKQLRNTFSARLQQARKMRGLSISELAKRLNGVVSSTAIEKYEKAVMFPQSSGIIVALAEVLQIPMGDLLKPITMKIDHSKFSFRKKSKLGKKAEEKILYNIDQRIEKYFEIENVANTGVKYTLGQTQYIIDSDEKARQAARDVRNAWNLGNQPIALPISLLEEHGIMVIEVDEDPVLFDGTSNTVNGIPVIIINRRNKDVNRPEEERRRLTTFHEFGHQYLTFPEGISEKVEEDLCNVFANEMLIPSDVFISLIGIKRKNIYPVELRNIQEVYGISSRALMMKAKQLGIITENTHKWFCISLNKNMKLKEFVDACILKQTHTTRFEQLVIRSVATETISTGKAAELLGITTGELHDKLNIA